MNTTRQTRPRLIEAVAITDTAAVQSPPPDVIDYLEHVAGDGTFAALSGSAPDGVVRSYLRWRDKWSKSVAVDFADELDLAFSDGGDAGQRVMETMRLREANEDWVVLHRPAVVDYGAALSNYYDALEDRGLKINGMLMMALNRVVGYGMETGAVYLGPAVVEPAARPEDE